MVTPRNYNKICRMYKLVQKDMDCIIPALTVEKLVENYTFWKKAKIFYIVLFKKYKYPLV